MAGNNQVIEMLWGIEGNRHCIDCKAKDPDWASINLGILMCLECSGIHRHLGVHISKVRSLKLDVDCWQGALLEFMCSVGNTKYNRLMEANVPRELLRPEDHPLLSFVRENFILEKYIKKSFMLDQGKERCLATLSECSIRCCLAPKTSDSLLCRAHESITSMREGYLTKSSGVNTYKKWQKRWFSLHGSSLSYFKKKNDAHPAAVIELHGVHTRLESFDSYAKEKCFSLDTGSSGGGRVYALVAESDKVLLAWVHAIRVAAGENGVRRGGLGMRPSSFGAAESAVSSVDDVVASDVVSYIEQMETEFLSRSAERCGPGQAIMAGRLIKRSGGGFRAWQQRHVVLTRSALFYFKDENALEKPAGVVLLKGARVQLPAPDTAGVRPYEFLLLTPLRQLALAGNCEGERVAWMAAIKAQLASNEEAQAAMQNSSSDSLKVIAQVSL